MGQIHICNDGGNELPEGSSGVIYFSDGHPFSYHADPDRTAAAYNDKGWSTLGDIGRLDEDGYLYLLDRKSFVIISGGVNIYPQEIEDLIVKSPEGAGRSRLWCTERGFRGGGEGGRAINGAG